MKVLIADDSDTDARILKTIFESESDMTVVGIARDGHEAVAMAAKYHPDIITMDIKMPRMDGYEAIDIIMKTQPVPVVVISSKINDNESDATFRAIEAGALIVLPKPVDIMSPNFVHAKRTMIDTVKSMAEIKVIKKRKISGQTNPKNYSAIVHGDYELIAIGASVGGPQVLKEILSRLPSNFPVPIVIVQHMSAGFITGFTKWLDSNVAIKIKLAEENEILQPGVVYIAPDQHHLEVYRVNKQLKFTVNKGDLVAGFCPSITVLMNSVAKHCGKHAIGVLLTGMGSDGADGMKALSQVHSHTIIQDAESCVVFGMAKVAESMGVVDKTVELDKIAEYLIRVTNKKN